MPSAARLPLEQERLVTELFDATVRRSERWISTARVCFCVLVLARRASWGGFWDGERVPPSAWVMGPAVLATLVFSGWLALRTRRARLGAPLLFTSVAVDAVVCFLGLASNAWFAPSYQGIAAHPDAIALMLMIAVAGFRLSPAAAAFGAALNLLSFVSLLVIDQLFVPPQQLVPRMGGVFLILLCLLFAAALSIAVARRAQAMATDAARSALQAERARTSLGTLLEEHHDLKSTLSAALLNAELMQREMQAGGVLDDAGRKHAADLMRDLTDAAQAMRSLRARVLGEATALDLPATVDVKDAVTRAARVVAQRHPSIVLDVDLDSRAVARVAGGAPAMERIALNLLLNACEGDGVRGARLVRVRSSSAAGEVSLHVHDDGPGLAGRPARGSRKPNGSGLGLLIVEALVSASGGTLQLDDAAPGAHACVRLPATV